MDSCNTIEQGSERILARQLARELSREELEQISGGLMRVGALKYSANSSSVNTCTVCCDCDGGADD